MLDAIFRDLDLVKIFMPSALVVPVGFLCEEGPLIVLLHLDEASDADHIVAAPEIIPPFV